MQPMLCTRDPRAHQKIDWKSWRHVVFDVVRITSSRVKKAPNPICTCEEARGHVAGESSGHVCSGACLLGCIEVWACAKRSSLEEDEEDLREHHQRDEHREDEGLGRATGLVAEDGETDAPVLALECVVHPLLLPRVRRVVRTQRRGRSFRSRLH